MGRTLRLFEGRFGRLVLGELAAQERLEAQADPAIVLQANYDGVLFLNPDEAHVTPGATRVLVVHASREWLSSSFPAVFAREEARPFSQGVEPITPRIRRAIALLRARPNKELNMDQLASQVGLSRSRFYDLFQLCTGFSPRAYLVMLCVETAISRLSSGRGKIAEVAAELGFSAQSNFTRFFLNQVGVPPSEYRRATATQQRDEPSPAVKPHPKA